MDALKPVTDPAILAQLNGDSVGLKPVTDPAILAQLNGTPPDEHHSMLETAADVVHAIPGGAAKGFSALAGIPGDIHAGVNAAGDWLTSKLDPESLPRMQAARQQIEQESIIPQAPTSGQILNTVAKPFGGMYEPKTVPGQYAETVSSFAPNALAPGSIGERLARVLIPGAASETAGQATKGKSYEPIARAVGALAGGIGEGLGEGALASKAHPVPSLDDLQKAKTAAYQAADQAGVVIKPQSFQQFATDLGTDFTKNNVVQADLHKNALSALSIIQDEAASGAPVTLSRADAIRQAIGGAMDNATPGDARLVKKIKTALDGYLDSIGPQDVLSGDPVAAVPILKEARGIAQRQFKSQEIQKLIDLAENQAGSNYSASGMEQSLRVQFKNLNAKLIKDPSLANSFTQPERDAIVKVIQGGPLENALRLFGKLAPTNNISAGVGPMLGAGAGALFGGPAGAVGGAAALPAAATMSRLGATALTSRNARLAAELMRSGVVNPGATALPRNVLLSTLLSQGVH